MYRSRSLSPKTTARSIETRAILAVQSYVQQITEERDRANAQLEAVQRLSDAKIEILEEQLKESEGLKIKLQGNAFLYDCLLKNADEKIDNLKNQISESESRLEESKARIDELEKIKIHDQEFVERLEEELESQKAEFQAFKTQSQAELHETEVLWFQGLNDYKARSLEFQKYIIQTEKKFEELETKRVESRIEFVSLRNRCFKSDANAKALDQALVKLNAKFAEANAQIEIKTFETLVLNGEVDALKKLIESRKAQFTEVNASLVKATNQLKAKDKELKELEIEKQKESDLLDFWQVEVQSGKCQKKGCEQEKDAGRQLQTELDRSRVKIRFLEGIVSDLKNELAEQKAQVAQKTFNKRGRASEDQTNTTYAKKRRFD